MMPAALTVHVAAIAALLSVPALSVVPQASAAEIQTPTPGCNGTLLQLTVRESGESRADRFRFNLRLEADASTSADALDQLNARLAAVRNALTPLIQTPLVIPSPSTTAMGGSAPSKRFRASTGISGTVGRANYNTLIQRAGRLPGVRLQGMTSLPSADDQASLLDRLLEQALRRGRRQAERTASILGRRRVTLLRIDQRSTPPGIRTMSADAASRFQPEEAPKPTGSVSLALDFCLN